MRDLYAPPLFLIQEHVISALKEDFGHGFDLTSQTVLPKNTSATVHMVARQDLILSGCDWATAALKTMDPTLEIHVKHQDSDFVPKGTVIMAISGGAREIMSAERVALNFMGHLSGIATFTNHYAQLIKETQARVTCTRKTLPSLRYAQKYAVRCGGGISHRSGLDDAILIKDNHIGVCGSVTQAIDNARKSIGHTTKIEIECDHFDQYIDAFEARADIIMLDNMSLETLRQCVDYKKELRKSQGIILEASGGVTQETIYDIAACGVDVISVGALTHSAPNADIAFDFVTLK